MHLKTKIILALSLILATTFLATSLINYAVTRELIREELLHSSLPLTGRNIYSEIQGAMMRPILVGTAMANDSFLQDWVAGGELDTEKITRYLSGIKEKYGFMNTFFVSSGSDLYYNQNGILKSVGARNPKDVWFFAFTRTKKEYDLNVALSEGDNDTLSIFVNCRVENAQGRLLGVTGTGVNIARITNRIEAIQKKYARSVFLVDLDGLIQVHQDRTLIGSVSIAKAEGIHAVAKGILGVRDRVTAHEYDLDGHHHLLSARFIPELEWFLIVDQDESVALKPARDNLYSTLGVGAGATLLVILLCAAMINHFQTRLTDMARTDLLTGTGNRRAMEDRFGKAVYARNRYSTPFSIILLNIDNFKAINDIHGHSRGDNVLRVVAEILTSVIRPTDLLARWGNDEFIILLDGNKKDAKDMAARIGSTVIEAPLPINVTVAWGTTEYRPGDTLDSITARADRRLHRRRTGTP